MFSVSVNTVYQHLYLIVSSAEQLLSLSLVLMMKHTATDCEFPWYRCIQPSRDEVHLLYYQFEIPGGQNCMTKFDTGAQFWTNQLQPRTEQQMVPAWCLPTKQTCTRERTLFWEAYSYLQFSLQMCYMNENVTLSSSLVTHVFLLVWTIFVPELF